MAEDFDNHRRSSMPVLSVSKGRPFDEGSGQAMIFQGAAAVGAVGIVY